MPIEHERDRWPGPDDTRQRQWIAAVTPGVGVVVRHAAVLADGEQLTEYPKTLELTWAEWTADVNGEPAHRATYGLTVTGRPVAEDTADRAAWLRLRRAAAGEVPVDQQYARAVLRVLRGVARELT